jgi:hypothetical protein
MRKIVTTIKFEFDETVMLSSEDRENTMSDEDLLLHAATCFTEDIEQMVKYNELFQVALAQTRFVDVEKLQQCGPGQELTISDGTPEEGHQPGT